MRFLVWVVVSVSKLVMTLLGLAILLSLGWGVFWLVRNLEDKLIPCLILLRLLSKRVKSMAFLDCRFLSDRTSTYDRIFKPDDYYWDYLRSYDRFRVFIVRAMPSIRNRSDFGRYPLPFNLYESDKLKSYMKKTFLWNVVVVGLCIYWLVRGFGAYWVLIVPAWGLTSFIGLLFMAIEKRSKKFSMKVRKPIKFLNRCVMELFDSLSLGIVTRSFRLTRFRARGGVLLIIVIEGLWFIFLALKYLLVIGGG